MRSRDWPSRQLPSARGEGEVVETENESEDRNQHEVLRFAQDDRSAAYQWLMRC